LEDLVDLFGGFGRFVWGLFGGFDRFVWRIWWICLEDLVDLFGLLDCFQNLKDLMIVSN